MRAHRFMDSTDDRQPDRQSAFLDVYTRAQIGLYRYVLTLVPNRTEAEDIQQEVARVLWQKFEGYDPARPFLPWAQRVAYLEVLKHRRSFQRSRVRFSDTLVERLATEEAEDADLLGLQHEALDGCLKRLSESDRHLLAQRYTGEKAVSQIARERGKSVNAVSIALHRVRRSLLECVERAMLGEGGR